MDKGFIIGLIALLLITYTCMGTYIFLMGKLGDAIVQKREEQRQQELEDFRKRIRK